MANTTYCALLLSLMERMRHCPLRSPVSNRSFGRLLAQEEQIGSKFPVLPVKLDGCVLFWCALATCTLHAGERVHAACPGAAASGTRRRHRPDRPRARVRAREPCQQLHARRLRPRAHHHRCACVRACVCTASQYLPEHHARSRCGGSRRRCRAAMVSYTLTRLRQAMVDCYEAMGTPNPTANLRPRSIARAAGDGGNTEKLYRTWVDLPGPCPEPEPESCVSYQVQKAESC
jgi:hypothetical protein